MQVVSYYTSKYNTATREAPEFIRKSDSTKKWVGITLDIQDMRTMLMTAGFDDKFKLMRALSVAERKQAWHYRQEDFDLQRASVILSAVKRTQQSL